MKEIIDLIGIEKFREFYERFINKQSHLVLQRLCENLQQLETRNQEYQDVESIFAHDLIIGGKQYTLDEAQMMLLNKVEALHQQIYATISTFIKLISHVRLNDQKINFPNRSVNKFLDTVSETAEYKNVLSEEICVLKKSIKYRDTLVDHPQSMEALDWATIGSNFEYSIIYYAHDAETGNIITDEINMMDPEDEHYHPPIGTNKFFVSPNRKKTIIAMKSFVTKFLITRMQIH